MAEKAQSGSRFVSKIPIRSDGPKATFSNVKKAKSLIESNEAALAILMKEKFKCNQRMEAAAINSFKEISSSSPVTTQRSSLTTKSRIPVPATTARPETATLHSSGTRTCIRTPGGSKRKVRPSHMNFQVTLRNYLKHNVRAVEDAELKVDDLLTRLESCQHIQFLPTDRRHVLHEVAVLFGKRITYRGKRKEQVYQGLELINQPDESVPVQSLSDLSIAGPGDTEPHPGGSYLTVVSPAHKIAAKSPSHRPQEAMKSRKNLFGGNDALEESSQEKFAQVFHSLGSTLDMASEMAASSKTDTSANIRDMYALNSKVQEMEKAIEDYVAVTEKIIVNQQETIKHYKDIVDSGKLLGGLMTVSERQNIKTEIQHIKRIFNLGIRNTKEITDMMEILDPHLFSRILFELKQHCPVIMNIIEQLVISSNTSRNVQKTITMKLKASVHALASLMDIRDQNAKNDIPILFGLLCLCYGAGPSLIQFLQHLGLSESHAVLCNVLRNQLKNYKLLINKRVPKEAPVITYQDNMQLMRTSMRHLRLSKLQKEKLKQNKIWDFTVRGWRPADVEGIEELFHTEATAVTSQKEVSKLEHKDVTIENNPDHLRKWNEFKERDLLRKLSLGLNDVPLTDQQLCGASCEQLKGLSGNFDQTTDASKPNFVINVPDIPKEFPGQSHKKTTIYPLPISQENQCKTLGMARNLDIFGEEFGFIKKEKNSSLRLLKSGEDFDLDLAYTRYAFLKSMEKHKERQKILETHLRGDGGMEESTGGENDVLLVCEESDSDSAPDSDN